MKKLMLQIKKQIEDDKKGIIIAHICILTVLAYMVLYNIKQLDIPMVFNDEFGYWGNAIAYIRHGWKDLLSITPVYSVGYSMWLMPIVCWVKNSFAAYRIAIVINLFFLVGVYFVANRCYMLLFENGSKITRVIVAFTCTCMCDNLFYSQITWSENLICLLYWLSLLLTIKCEKTNRIRYYVLLIADVLYLYLVHQRTIGIIVAIVLSEICMIINCYNKRKQILRIFCTGVVAVLIVFINTKVILELKNAIYTDSGYGNVLSINSDTLYSYGSQIINSFTNFFLSVIGKMEIMVCMTFGLLFFPLKVCVKRLYNVKYKKAYLYIMLSSFLMLILSGIQMINYEVRTDMIVYSRYMSFTIGPYMLVTFGEMKKNDEKIRQNVLMGIGVFLMALSCIAPILKGKGIDNFATVCSPIVGSTYEFLRTQMESTGDMYQTLLFWGFILLIIFLCILVVFRKKYYERLIICIAFFSITLYWFGNNYNIMSRNGYRDYADNIASAINEEADYPIYYVFDSNNKNPMVKYAQYRIWDRDIMVVTQDELNKISGVAWIIAKNDVDMSGCQNASKVFSRSEDIVYKMID